MGGSRARRLRRARRNIHRSGQHPLVGKRRQIARGKSCADPLSERNHGGLRQPKTHLLSKRRAAASRNGGRRTIRLVLRQYPERGAGYRAAQPPRLSDRDCRYMEHGAADPGRGISGRLRSAVGRETLYGGVCPKNPRHPAAGEIRSGLPPAGSQTLSRRKNIYRLLTKTPLLGGNTFSAFFLALCGLFQRYGIRVWVRSFRRLCGRSAPKGQERRHGQNHLPVFGQ